MKLLFLLFFLSISSYAHTKDCINYEDSESNPISGELKVIPTHMFYGHGDIIDNYFFFLDKNTCFSTVQPTKSGPQAATRSLNICKNACFRQAHVPKTCKNASFEKVVNALPPGPGGKIQKKCMVLQLGKKPWIGPWTS